MNIGRSLSILLFLACLLIFLPRPSVGGEWWPFHLLTKPSAQLVAQGSIAAGDNKMDYTADNSFIEFNVDISAYQDGNHRIVLTDSANKSASGIIHSVAPGGVTFGDELVTNGIDFTGGPPPTGWAENGSTLTAEAGGQAGNCLQLLAATPAGTARQAQSVTLGGVHYFSGYKKDGTAGARISLDDDAYTVGSSSDIYYNSSDATNWTLCEKYFNALTASVYMQFHVSTSVDARTSLFDTISLKRLTDCAATGALIVSTLGGAPRSWTRVDSGFNPNLACEWKIFRVNE